MKGNTVLMIYYFAQLLMVSLLLSNANGVPIGDVGFDRNNYPVQGIQNKKPWKPTQKRTVKIDNEKHLDKKTKEIRSEKFMVVIVPSYNNKEWYAINLASIFSQKYTNYHVIYIDDNSTDGTGDLVAEYIKNKKLEDKITLIRNSERCYAAENRHRAIHSCPDYAIIVNIDGDDWWLRDDMLSVINKAYEDKNVWLTYGQFVNWPTNVLGYGRAIPEEIIRDRSFRSYRWVIGQSRTFYAWLYKQIKQEDLMVDGHFFTTSTDIAIMCPLMEMVGDKFRFIDGVYYIRNVATDLNLFKVAHEKQKENGAIIRGCKKYDQIKKLPIDQLAGVRCAEYTTTKICGTQYVWKSRFI